jgi:uncharacterized membrane-anchored protein
MTLELGYYVGLAVTFALFVVILAFQIGLPRFHPILFWLSIIATTTAGTEISDFMDRSLDVGYFGGSAILFAALLLTLAYWYWRFGDLRVDRIAAKGPEIVFWAAVLFSNSLGTAFGDFLVDNVGLSFIQGAFVTAGIIAVVALLHYARALNDVLLFWIAFVFTRPFGATFGDFLTKPTADGGLSLPRGSASLVTLGLLLLILLISERFASERRAGEEVEPG